MTRDAYEVWRAPMMRPQIRRCPLIRGHFVTADDHCEECGYTPGRGVKHSRVCPTQGAPRAERIQLAVQALKQIEEMRVTGSIGYDDEGQPFARSYPPQGMRCS